MSERQATSPGSTTQSTRVAVIGGGIVGANLSKIGPLLETLLESGIESVAIGFLNAYRNPIHEEQLAALVRQRFEFVSTSTAVLNEIREYERLSTCVVNAYVMPVMARCSAPSPAPTTPRP
ncbi:MAG: hydantoinase/oxoprolinase N-terminal domain-containing protein [Dongiaceae bacterium]